MNLTDRPHPILDVLADQGRKATWLAKRTGYSNEHLSRVFHRRLPATPTLRLACALALGLPESELFHCDVGTPERAA